MTDRENALPELDGLAEYFDRAIRMRGAEYAKNGSVIEPHVFGKMLTARVRGGEIYKVEIDWSDGETNYNCTCPYSKQHGACKHIWATLLMGAEKKFLPRELAQEILQSHSTAAAEPIAEDEEEEVDPEIDADAPAGSSIVMPGFRAPRAAIAPLPEGGKAPAWKMQLRKLAEHVQAEAPPPPPMDPLREKKLFYVANASATLDDDDGNLVVDLFAAKLAKTGAPTPPKQVRLSRGEVSSILDPVEQNLLRVLAGMQQGYFDFNEIGPRFGLDGKRDRTIVRQLCQSGRLVLLDRDDKLRLEQPLMWDAGPAWEFLLRATPDVAEGRFEWTGWLRRGEEEIPLTEPDLLIGTGLVISNGKIAELEHSGAWGLLSHLRSSNKLLFWEAQLEEMLEELLNFPALPPIELAPALNMQAIAQPPTFRLRVRPPAKGSGAGKLNGEVLFDYAGTLIPFDQATSGQLFKEERKFIARDRTAENAAFNQLYSAGLRGYYDFSTHRTLWPIVPKQLDQVVRELITANWQVDAEGKRYRTPGQMRVEVASGIDWFGLTGTVEFGDQTASLPALLAALQKGETVVQLGDGTVGLLPKDWLAKYAALAGVGEVDGDELKFKRSQVGLLDALLAAMPEASVDEAFAKARRQLSDFDGIEAADAPEGFIGTLRAYQREGLGWMRFLGSLGLGACLADDMGLGKTVQVLSLLHKRKETVGKPALVVVPRSLVFNWLAEAARFSPDLRLLNHTGTGRARSAEVFNDYDVIVTTYGTLRLDIPFIKDFKFDYAILDEAQAIKNSNAESAKAVRLLAANCRLALSGTPIENHLGELWSLFEFLNPGMLGRASVFREIATGKADVEGRRVLSRALRPYILRRTKEQVATDLPPKLEQTITCELEPEQRKLYDQLRDHYRESLLTKMNVDELGRSKMQVLEALLRLRQASCHPGLIDKTRVGESSAKLDTLLTRIEEIVEPEGPGHKVLVFSQFTSFLSIVRSRLDERNVVYEYLDGKTRDRAARVNRFQSDENCRVFLISLKAGGLGLNLTAADYVFLLDPWWNPAVEAQAIDRAHRIGQTKNVFAYRLIARDTVEEKVLELQKSKKDLADAIITEDNSLLSNLGRAELELLLS